MSFFSDFIKKYKFDLGCDRLGPDIPFTHWKLYFKSSMINICKRKFEKFGDESQFRAGAYAIGCSQIQIGERVVIRPLSMLHGETNTLKTSIVIEDDVLLGSGVHIYVENHAFDDPRRLIVDQGHHQAELVHIKRGAWIGANSVILPGVTIGENAVVGAGSIVTKSIPAFSLAVGAPAKVIREII